MEDGSDRSPGQGDSAASSSSAADGGASDFALSNLHIKSVSDLANISNHLPVRWDELPKVPFFGPIIGFTDQWYRAAVALTLLETRWRSQRVLTQDEVQVVAGQTAKAVVTMSYELPFLLATTFVYERRGRATFRFPFYQPGDGFNPNVFPSAKYALLQGPPARSLWHMARATLYGSITHWTLRTLFISYALSVKNMEFERDPRLVDLRSSIHSNLAARQAATRQNQQIAPFPGSHDNSQHTGAVSPSSAPADGSTGLHEDMYGGQPPPPPAQQQQQARAYPGYRPPPPQQPAAVSDDFADDDFGDSALLDDASPVSASERRQGGWKAAAASAAAAENASGGSSAWDRLRTQAITGAGRAPPQGGWGGRRAGPAKTPAHAADSAEGDDYTFREADAEKTSARELAQKEFDEMLERERRGEADSPRGRR